MTYNELVAIIDHTLCCKDIDNSEVVAEQIADELKARGLYLDTEEDDA